MDLKNTKILILAPHYNYFIKGQIEAISKFVSEITVIVCYNPVSIISRILPIHYLKSFQKRNLINTKALPKNVRIFKRSVFYLPVNFSYKKLGIKQYKKIEKIINKKKISFDVIHAHFLWSSGFVGSKLKITASKPLIITAHGFDVYSLPERDWWWSNTITKIAKAADKIITVSQRNKRILQTMTNSENISIVPNGFDEQLHHPQEVSSLRKKLKLPSDKKIILTIGNLSKIKGHEVLIDALLLLKMKREDFICILIGDGPIFNQLSRKIKKLGLSSEIILKGYVPYSEVPEWYNVCDIFVLPSLDEGNPTVMFEALGNGKPFIGTNVGGIPEIIKSDKIGLLTTPSNSSELFKIIEDALEIEWDNDFISNYALKYSWDSSAEKLRSEYTNVLKERRDIN